MFKHLLRSGYPRISRKFEMALSNSGVYSKIDLLIYRNVYMKKNVCVADPECPENSKK